MQLSNAGDTALILAARCCDPMAIYLLLGRTDKVDLTENKKGWTALMEVKARLCSILERT